MHHPFWQPAALIEELTLEGNIFLPNETSRGDQNETTDLVGEVRGEVCGDGSA
jgi:hypothetical protein